MQNEIYIQKRNAGRVIRQATLIASELRNGKTSLLYTKEMSYVNSIVRHLKEVEGLQIIIEPIPESELTGASPFHKEASIVHGNSLGYKLTIK